MKRVLIISNNPLSTIYNNGKTLESFFKEYPSDKVAQLYFSEQKPSSSHVSRYYRVSDRDVLNFVTRKSKTLGSVEKNYKSEEASASPHTSIGFKKGEVIQLVREILWSIAIPKMTEMLGWVDEFDPEVIFFCGGDCQFAYKITEIISKRRKTDNYVFITDDYFFGKTHNLLGLYKRRKLKKMFGKLVSNSQGLFVISKRMKAKYEKEFMIKSKVIHNIYEDVKFEYELDFKNINLVYAGGFHYKRLDVLDALGDAVSEVNKEGNTVMSLTLFSQDVPSQELLNKWGKKQSISFRGALTEEQLLREYMVADILVLVESFDKNVIEKTKYSLSTKISEYIVLDKPILSIGPIDAGSIDYLKDVAITVNNVSDIYDTIRKLSKDEKYIKKAAERSKELHKSSYFAPKQRRDLYTYINE